MENLKDVFQEFYIQERAFALFYNTANATEVTSVHTEQCSYFNQLNPCMNLHLQFYVIKGGSVGFL